MKKNNMEPTLVKDGYVDCYYCFKFSKRKDYHKAYRKLLQDICSIARFDIDNNGEVIHYTKGDFSEFIANEAEKFAAKLTKNINSEFKDISNDPEFTVKVTAYETNIASNTNIDGGENSNAEKIRLSIPFPFEDFINESIMLTKQFIDSNNIYFNKNLKFYNYNLILQPLKILIDNVEYFVNVRANIYSTGSNLSSGASPFLR